MSRYSFFRFFRIPLDQRIGILSILVTLLTLIVSAFQFIPSPISYIIGSVAIILSSFLFFISIRSIIRRELTYGISDHLSVFSDLFTNTSTTFREHITILYDGQQVENVHTALLKIHNRGNSRIDKEDFHKKPLKINFSSEIILLDAAVKYKSQQGNTIMEPQLTRNCVTLEPFSLAVQEWFDIRCTFEFQGADVVRTFTNFDIESKDDFAFTLLRDDSWQEKYEKRTKRRDYALASVLLAISILAILTCIYVWFYSGTFPFLSFPYQFLLTFIISVGYFSMIFSMILSRNTQKPSL